MIREYDFEAMQEILAEHGINVTFDEAKGIANDFIDCYITHRECEAPIPCPNKESDFERADRLQRELDAMTRKYNSAKDENNVYNKYIQKRSGAITVGVENGLVYFEW